LIRSIAALLATGLLLMVSALAQDVDPSSLEAMHWRLIGSFRGGRVTAVAGIPDDPSVYYFATPGGGIWKTTDAGHVWQPIFDSEHVASVGALAIAPSDVSTIYAGTGEQTPGDGVYKSSDAGATWTHAGLENTRFIQSVIVDPRDPKIVIAGANSIGMYVFSRPAPIKTFSTERGIFKTMDGGKTWTQTLRNDETAGVFDLEVDPDNPHVLYASLYVPASGLRPSLGGKAADSLLYKSTDQGSTWAPLVSKGLPESGRGRVGISVASGTGGRRMYAIMNQGFFRSDDAGKTWSQSTRDPRILGSEYFSRIFADTKNPEILYVAQTSLYRSLDGGHTFAPYVGAPSGDDFHVLWIDPKDPSRLLLGVDQGAILSVDAGSTWSSWYNQPTGQFYHVTTDHAFPYRTYAAQQDSGTQSVPSRSDNGEITPQDVTSVGGFEFCYIAPDPLHPDWIYSGGWYGTVVRYDRKTGQTATVFEKGDQYRVAQMPPLFFAPHDAKTLYLGTQYVLKTTDEGKSWQRTSPDLTEWDHVDASEDDPDKPHPPAIEALAASPVDAAEMWAATTNRLVQLTRDGGATWHKVTPPGLASPAEILYVEPSHHDAARAYLAIGSSRQALPPQVLRTRDYGATWQSITEGLPASDGVRVVREDPVRKGLLFAGTDSSVFLSFDDGDHWHPFTLNLPASPVTDIEVHDDDLVISTYGRGLWILDNITPVRQLTPEILAAKAHLFAPATALRVRWDTNQDTPLPIETPTGKNPPDGVSIDYYLPATLAEAPSITIRDAKGDVVRRFSGTSREPDLPLPNVPEYWFAKPLAVDEARGLHRFVWDLRYEAPRTLPAAYSGPILQYTEYTLADHAIPHETPRQQPQGPLVVPGLYTIEFSGGGLSVKQPLTVKLDPRVRASQADLEIQLSLARRILNGISVSYEDYQQLQLLKSALDRLKKSQPAQTSGVAPSEIDKQIEAVESGSKAAPGLAPINRDLTRLLDSVESADQRPTEPQLQAVNEVCDALLKATARWQTLNNSLQKQDSLKLGPPKVPATAGCSQ
jgi:photosystem II stability/assembly factor-like uncharacterized protein